MLALTKGDASKGLRMAHDEKLHAALLARRGGKTQEFLALSREAEALLAEIERLDRQN